MLVSCLLQISYAGRAEFGAESATWNALRCHSTVSEARVTRTVHRPQHVGAMIRRRRTGANLDARTTTASRCPVPTPSPRVATGGGAEDVSGHREGATAYASGRAVARLSGPWVRSWRWRRSIFRILGGLSHPWDTCDASCQLYCPTWGVRRDPRLLAPGDRRYSSRSASTVVDQTGCCRLRRSSLSGSPVRPSSAAGSRSPAPHVRSGRQRAP